MRISSRKIMMKTKLDKLCELIRAIDVTYDGPKESPSTGKREREIMAAALRDIRGY